MAEPRCKRLVSDRTAWVGPHQCQNRAVTEDGYCRLHDPYLAQERAAKRPATKYERLRAARKAVDAVIDALPEPARTDLARLVHAERMLQ